MSGKYEVVCRRVGWSAVFLVKRIGTYYIPLAFVRHKQIHKPTP